MKNVPSFVLLAFFSASATAAESTCAALANSIDSGLKFIAMEWSSGVLDNSAPRENNRLIRTANELMMINTHVQLMGQNKCPPITEPLSHAVYLSAALSCQTAKMGRSSRDERQIPECDMKAWKKSTKE